MTLSLVNKQLQSVLLASPPVPTSQRSPSPEECSVVSSLQTAWHMPPSPWPWYDPSLRPAGVCQTTCNKVKNNIGKILNKSRSKI